MAVLSDSERANVLSDKMTAASRSFEQLGLTKAQLRAAVNATDQWINDNAASYNQALPLAARQVLTARQKVKLFLAVAKKRFEVA